MFQPRCLAGTGQKTVKSVPCIYIYILYIILFIYIIMIYIWLNRSASPPSMKINSKTYGTLEKTCLEFVRLSLPVKFQNQFVSPRLVFCPLAQLLAKGIEHGVSIRPSRLRVVVVCALLLQRDKAMDSKSYADSLLVYCICAPRIQFFPKFISGWNLWSNQRLFWDRKDCWSKSCVRYSSKRIKSWISNPDLLLRKFHWLLK